MFPKENLINIIVWNQLDKSRMKNFIHVMTLCGHMNIRYYHNNPTHKTTPPPPPMTYFLHCSDLQAVSLDYRTRLRLVSHSMLHNKTTCVSISETFYVNSRTLCEGRTWYNKIWEQWAYEAMTWPQIQISDGLFCFEEAWLSSKYDEHFWCSSTSKDNNLVKMMED
jgi:hypothetical protein